MTKPRRHQRRTLPLLVQYRFSSTEEFHTDYTVNIGGGGLYVQTVQPPTLGAEVQLKFIMKNSPRIIQCRGRVIRVDADGKKQPPGFAVQFIDLDEEDHQAILELVDTTRPNATGDPS